MEFEEITSEIIKCAYKVHNILGSGFLERVYEKALSIGLQKAGFGVECHYPIAVFYDGQQIGDFFADLLIDNYIMIELKAVENILPVHEVQLVNYLTATKTDIGLIINFSKSVQVKRKYRTNKSARKD